MKVLLVDDSALVRNILKEVFRNEKNITVVGEAANGQIAVEKNRELRPDLIIMDLNMPKMDGLEAIKRIMEDQPTAIIVLSNILDATNSYKSINYGAVEVMKKPGIDRFNDPEFLREFMKKLHTIGELKISRLEDSPALVQPADLHETRFRLVVIGASTGGPAAIRTILRKIPAGLPLCFALVQHLESGFDKSFTQWLGESSHMPVVLASENKKLENGKLFVAPTDKHLVIRDNVFSLDDGERVLNQKPSVDVLFRSAARELHENVIGVLLTGMGSDGAEGCVAIKKAGGITIVQDQKTSTIFGMPKAAIEKNAATRVLPLDDIPVQILNYLQKKS